ncbi:MAG TPA: type II secretion system protein [Acidobacteriaceae bacterium]|nr:type II secretion system protein [Acidobacteriaceae bacterium]
MTTRTHLDLRHQKDSNSEAGFMLVFAIFLVALVFIALAVAAPVVAKDLQREKELESEHRAEQYVRAIRLFYNKNKTYPPSIDALESTNNVRYLRKQYIDPLTGKNDWRIIHVGENKTTVKGFFGQPLGGLNTTGAGSLGSASSMASGGMGSNTAGSASSTVSGGSPLSAGFSGATIGGSTSGSSTSGASSSTTSSSGSGGIGQIMGVGTSKTGQSILNPNGQSTYETWEFIYDPRIELLYKQANILGGGSSVNSTSPSSLGSPAGTTGQPNTQGGSSATPPAPTAPQ